jgi:hypothetical protein
MLLAVLVLSNGSFAQNCDPWIVQIYKQLYNRTPSAEECNIRNYNNGSWNNYDQLVSYIKAYNSQKSTASTPSPAAACMAVAHRPRSATSGIITGARGAATSS